MEFVFLFVGKTICVANNKFRCFFGRPTQEVRKGHVGKVLTVWHVVGTPNALKAPQRHRLEEKLQQCRFPRLRICVLQGWLNMG